MNEQGFWVEIELPVGRFVWLFSFVSSISLRKFGQVTTTIGVQFVGLTTWETANISGTSDSLSLEGNCAPEFINLNQHQLNVWAKMSADFSSPFYSVVQKKCHLFENSRLVLQLGQPMHSQSASFGKFKLNSLNLAPFLLSNPVHVLQLILQSNKFDTDRAQISEFGERFITKALREVPRAK